MIRSLLVLKNFNNPTLRKEIPLSAESQQISDPALREDLSDYVAHLQVHMTLQARNLIPPLTSAADSREQLLQQTQAIFEKHVSRQTFAELLQD